MPFQIACPAGHKLVIAGSAAEGPLVCPRCGLPVMADTAGTESSAPACEIAAPDLASARVECTERGNGDLPAARCENDASTPLAAVTSVTARLPVIRVQPKPSVKSHWKPGPGAFGGMLVAAALASSAPAIGELVAAYHHDGAGPGTYPAKWALMLVWLAVIQAAYGAYCWLWADWSSWRMVTLALVLQAGVYAALLAVILLADPHGWILGEGGLQLTAALAGGKAALACLTLICLCAILALFAGRQSMRRQAVEVRPRH